MSGISGAARTGVFADGRGESVIGFALVAPILILLSLGILEFALVIFDYHRAGEATRRAARLAAINAPIANVSGFSAGSSIECGSSGGTVSCAGAAVANAGVFDTIVGGVQAVLPGVTAANLVVRYSDSGIGDPTTPGGIIPLVSVRLNGVEHPFLFIGGFPGMPSAVTFPPFVTNQLGAGLGPTT